MGLRQALGGLSIRSQLLLLVCVFGLSLSVLYLWALLKDYRQAQEAAFSQVRGRAEAVATTLGLLLDDRMLALGRIAERPLLRALDRKRCDPFLAEYVGLRPEYATFTVRNLAGELICSLTGTPFSAAEINRLEWFRAAAASDRPLVGAGFQRSATGRWAAALTQPIRGNDGARAGVAILPIDLLTLNARLREQMHGTTFYFVIDAENKSILRSEDLETWIGRPASSGLMRNVEGRQAAQFVEAGTVNLPRLFAYVRMPGSGWQVFAAVPEAEVMAPYYAALTRSVAIGLALLATLILLALMISRSILRPVRALAAVAGRVAGGESAARAPTAGPPEIASVAQEFNRMLDARTAYEQRLRDSEQRYRALTELSSDWFWEQDEQFRYTRLEGKGLERLGIPVESLLGRTRWQRPASNLSEADWAAHRAALAAHQPFHDLRVQRVDRDGRVRWRSTSGAPVFDAGGRFCGYRGVGRDITEEYESQQMLKLLETSIERLNDVVMITEASPINAPGPRIVFVNDAFVRVTGYSREEIIGRTPRLLQGPATPRAELDRIRAALAANQPVSAELINYNKAGAEYWVEIEILPIADAAGKPSHFVAIERDITERRRAEALRQSLEAQLRESQKMEAVGTLAGGIAHDFNNIVGAILGNAALARQDAAGNPRVLESLDEISRSGKRARELVQQILSFSRRQPLQRRVLSLGTVAQESVRMLRATVPARITFDLAVAAGVPPILADENQLQQVLLNLVTNAVHAIGEGAGKISIGVDMAEFDADASAVGAAPVPGRCARLTVADTGKGMDEATLARIFEPFFTTKPQGEGTGLGLSVVHGIVRANEGHITVRSVAGVGTTFTACFPVLAEVPLPAPATAAPVLPAGPARQGGGQHILYVDDDEAMVFLVARLLKRAGYRVSAHTSQTAALAALGAASGDFDLLVTDYNMPGMSGLDVAAAARQIRPGLEIAIASGYITDELRERALQCGIDQLIFKPSAMDEFCMVIQRLLTRAPEGSRGNGDQ
jgi:PAS domain S-box-containing protein